MLDPNPSPNPDPDPNPNNNPNPNADPNPNPNADPDPTPTPTPSPNQARSRCSTSSRRAPAACLTAARPTSATPPHISQDLPRSPHISQDLPRSPEISPYLPTSPHIPHGSRRPRHGHSLRDMRRYAEIWGDIPRSMTASPLGCPLRLGAPACLLAHGAPLGLGAELRPRGPRGAAMEPLRGAAQARHCRCVRPCRHACARRGGRLAVREGGGRVRGESCGRERGRRGLENEAAVPAAVEWAGGAGGSPRRRAESVSSYSTHTRCLHAHGSRRCAIED